MGVLVQDGTTIFANSQCDAVQWCILVEKRVNGVLGTAAPTWTAKQGCWIQLDPISVCVSMCKVKHCFQRADGHIELKVEQAKRDCLHHLIF